MRFTWRCQWVFVQNCSPAFLYTSCGAKKSLLGYTALLPLLTPEIWLLFTLFQQWPRSPPLHKIFILSPFHSSRCLIKNLFCFASIHWWQDSLVSWIKENKNVSTYSCHIKTNHELLLVFFKNTRHYGAPPGLALAPQLPNFTSLTNSMLIKKVLFFSFYWSKYAPNQPLALSLLRSPPGAGVGVQRDLEIFPKHPLNYFHQLLLVNDAQKSTTVLFLTGIPPC